MSANSKGSGEPTLKRRLAWAFAGRLYDKYPFFMCWHIYLIQRLCWQICTFTVGMRSEEHLYITRLKYGHNVVYIEITSVKYWFNVNMLNQRWIDVV